ncbi:MAG TPA: hypothetical protein VNM48_20380 [Chloroflexota bacterium]|nr:hypothetical protein [Chloroflexota bacterium]
MDTWNPTTQHTPGPWTRQGGAIFAAMPDGDQNGIAVLSVPYRGAQRILPGPEIEANGDLMAAAPDLLEAARVTLQSPWHDATCVGWVEFREGTIFDADRGCTCFRAKLLAAVAKAEGAK